HRKPMRSRFHALQLGLELVRIHNRITASDELEGIDPRQLLWRDRSTHARTNVGIVRPLHEEVEANNAPAGKIVQRPVQKNRLHWGMRQIGPQCAGKPKARSSARPSGMVRASSTSALTGAVCMIVVKPSSACAFSLELSTRRDKVPMKPLGRG